MSIAADGPYRIWVYSLLDNTGLETDLQHVFLRSLKQSDANDIRLALDPVRLLDYPGWPLMHGQGGVSLERTAAGNDEFRWHARWARETYGRTGWAGEGVMADFADGPSASLALMRLWLLAVEWMRREVEADASSRWRTHFQRHMRPVKPPGDQFGGQTAMP